MLGLEEGQSDAEKEVEREEREKQEEKEKSDKARVEEEVRQLEEELANLEVSDNGKEEAPATDGTDALSPDSVARTTELPGEEDDECVLGDISTFARFSDVTLQRSHTHGWYSEDVESAPGTSRSFPDAHGTAVTFTRRDEPDAD